MPTRQHYHRYNSATLSPVLFPDHAPDERQRLLESLIAELSFVVGVVSSPYYYNNNNHNENSDDKPVMTNHPTNNQHDPRRNNYHSKHNNNNTVSKSRPTHWRTAVDPLSGRMYYFEKYTRRTQWEKPDEVKAYERHVQREARRQQKAFFRQMEANLLASLARGELIPGRPRLEKAGPPQEPLWATGKNNNRHNNNVRTISCMNDELLAQLQEQSIPFPVVQLSHHTRNAPQQPQQRPPRPPQYDEDLQGERLLDEPLLASSTCNHNNNLATTRPAALTAHSRRNTEGTVYVKSTMENPDIRATIKCICCIFRVHIIESSSSSSMLYHQVNHHHQNHATRIVPLSLFRDPDRRRPHQGTGAPTNEIPTLHEIECFFTRFYEKSQMEHDTLIMSLIYVERLIKETSGRISPTPYTWESILFPCMILASKVWDDLSMWNVDFANVSMAQQQGGQQCFSLQRINQLELAVLDCLNFNVKVKASEYAKYYYYIRDMLTKSGLSSDQQHFRGSSSRNMPSNPQKTSPPPRHRAHSVDFDQFFQASSSSSQQHQHSRTTDSGGQPPHRHQFHEPQQPADSLGPVLRESVCLEQMLVSLNR